MTIHVVISDTGEIKAAFKAERKAHEYAKAHTDEEHMRLRVQSIEVRDMQHYPSSM